MSDTKNDIQEARPAKYFAKPPYRAELFNKQTGTSGVMNKDGINCLTFCTGRTLSTYENCLAIAEKFNKENLC